MATINLENEELQWLASMNNVIDTEVILRSRPDHKHSVLVLLDRVSPGGVLPFAIRETRGLMPLGFQTQLYLLRGDVPRELDPFLERVETHSLDNLIPSIFGFDFKIPMFSFLSLSHLTSPLFFPFALKAKRRTTVISHGTYTCFSALAARVVRGVNYLAFIHDPISYILPRAYSNTEMRAFFPVLLPLGANLDRLICDNSHAVIIQSGFHFNLLRKLTDRPIHIIYPGVERTKSLPAHKKDFVLVVSRWEDNKHPFFMIDVARRLRDMGSGARLLVVGPWRSVSLRARFLRQVQEFHLESQIHLLGFVENTQLDLLYRQARCLLHPVIEAFGMIGLEAAAHGTPCIMPKGSGVSEILPHGEAGFFPVEGDESSFAECVNLLVKDEKLAKAMGKTAWTISHRYTWESHCRKLAMVLDTMA